MANAQSSYSSRKARAPEMEYLDAVPLFPPSRKLYSGSLGDHNRRVMATFEKISRVIEPKAVEHVKALIICHDDPYRILNGLDGEDLGLSAGEFKKMIGASVATLRSRYRDASILSFQYPSLLDELRFTRSEPVLIAEYLHTFDLWAIAVHEIFAGNRRFISLARKFTAQLQDQSLRPGIASKSGRRNPIFNVGTIDLEDRVSHGAAHTIDSFRSEVGYRAYDSWRRTVLSSCDEELVGRLVRQRYPAQPARAPL